MLLSQIYPIFLGTTIYKTLPLKFHQKKKIFMWKRYITKKSGSLSLISVVYDDSLLTVS